MDDVWQVQEAKARLGEVIDRALTEGPQTVTRHGKAVVKVVAARTAAAGSRPTTAAIPQTRRASNLRA